MLETLPNHSSNSILLLPTDFFTFPTRWQSVVSRAICEGKEEQKYKRLWSNLNFCCWIWLEVQRNPKRNQGSQFTNWDFESRTRHPPSTQWQFSTFDNDVCCLVYSTDNEMIPGRNAINGHTQDFVAKGELLWPVMKSFVQYTSSLHATRNAWYFQSLFSRTVCRCQQQQSRSPSYNQHPPHRAKHALTPSGINSFFEIYSFNTFKEAITRRFMF